MGGAHFTLNAQPTRAALKALASGLGRPLMKLVGIKMREQAARTFARGVDPVSGEKWKPTGKAALAARASGGGHPLKRTSGLWRDVAVRPPDVTDRTARIGTDKKYGEIHQLGGTITAKAGKSLAFPLNRKAARAGSARRWWAQMEASGVKPFIVKGKNGKRSTICVSTGKGKNAKVVAHWVLSREETIPRRRYLGIGPAYGAELEHTMAQFLDKLIKRQAGASQ